MIRYSALFLILLAFSLPETFAQTKDIGGPAIDPAPEPSQSLEQLLVEAQALFAEKRPLDARVKLQKALQIAPEDYRPHFFLGIYYLTEVAHFPMADKYLSASEQLFRKKFGSEEDGTLKQEGWRQNALILQYLTEAKLNLDRYETALKYADRFGKTYWDDWYPGTKAWILMKLRRVDEAIREAQIGVLRGADETRTYNILGILYSLKGNRRLALQAFRQAIRAELSSGYANQAATPLNNAGEVYRELFQDDMAEASWLRALQLPDGCDHILPSLNLTLLYIDQLRLFQAERALADFEACFAQRSLRSDTEHRALLALARGKIALRQGNIPKALGLLEQASERQQWYGKIGTNANDLKFAAAESLGQAYAAEASRLLDVPTGTTAERVFNRAKSSWLTFRAWWQNRKAREVAIKELNDFEDLYVRNTDAMLEYPTLGTVMTGIPEAELASRLTRMKEEDPRDGSKPFYDLYLAEQQVASGATTKTIELLEKIRSSLREVDILAKAETLGLLIRAREQQDGFFSGVGKAEAQKIQGLKEELFDLLPAQLRILDLALPVSVSTNGTALSATLLQELLRRRFAQVDGSPRYSLTIQTDDSVSGRTEINLSIVDTRRQLVVTSLREAADLDKGEEVALLNEFLDKVFGYRFDATAAPVPKLELLEDDAS